MGLDEQVAGFWSTIEVVLRREVPKVAANLNPPATADRIGWLERELGLKLPDDFIASLRVHDGIAKSYSDSTFVDGQRLLPSAEIVELRAMRNSVQADAPSPTALGLKEPSPRLWWDHRFVPVTDCEGDALCIDTGTPGCSLVFHVHDNGMDEEPTAASFGRWLAEIARRLGGGEFQVNDGAIWLRVGDG